jgi:hypothetical protein
MTWIVGAAAALGYAVGISDIRVTFSDGSERDCLQKIYPMSRFIAAGFAGSVRIGFAMLNALAHSLRDLPDGQAYIPQEVADTLSLLARDVFRRSPDAEKKLGSHLILLGAHPTDHMGAPGWSRCSVHILESPNFEPEAGNMGQVVSIGCGSVIPLYEQMLAGFTANPLSLLQGEVMGAKMGFVTLSMVMQKTVEKNPVPGISPHTHICVVRRGSVEIGSNNHDQYPQSGEKIEFRMPPVATTWAEFVQLAASTTKALDAVTC